MRELHDPTTCPNCIAIAKLKKQLAEFEEKLKAVEEEMKDKEVNHNNSLEQRKQRKLNREMEKIDEDEATILGLITRDTVQIPAVDYIFNGYKICDCNVDGKEYEVRVPPMHTAEKRHFPFELGVLQRLNFQHWKKVLHWLGFQNRLFHCLCFGASVEQMPSLRLMEVHSLPQNL